MNIEESGHTDVAEVELDEAIPKSTMYGVVVNGKFIAKGSKATMKKLAKEKGGQLYNSPRSKVGDSVGKSEEVELDEVNELVERAANALSVHLDMKEQLSKIKGNTPADQGRRGAVEDDIKRAEKRGDKKAVAKLKEDELDEAKPEYEVKYAKIASAKVRVTKFMTLDQAKEFLDKVKKDGMNGIISKGGKPVKEEAELDEKTKWKMGDGRPRGGSHIENERFWDLPKDSLEYIIKDAGEAMKANPTARKATTGRGNWADQVNDASTVLGWRKKNGIKEEAELEEALKPKDKKVVDAFYDGKSMDGVTLSTDGKTLKKDGMGAQTIATSSGNKFKIVADIDGKHTQSVVGYIKKSFPKNVVEDDFKPHMMYDPKTGKEYKADTYEDHLRMKEMGYVHEKPKMKEEVELDEAIPNPSKELQRANKLMGPSKNIEQGIQMVMKGMKVSEKEATRLANAAIDRIKKYGNKAFKEEVDESVQRAANAISFHEARKMSPAARARRDALRDIGKDNSKDDDEVTATDADRARADRNIITRFKKIADVSKEFSQKGKFATQYIKRIDPKTGKPEKERSGVTSPGTLKTYKIKFDQGPEKSVDLEDIKLVLALWDSGKLKSSTKLQLQKKMEKSSKDFKDAIDMLKRLLKKLVSKGR